MIEGVVPMRKNALLHHHLIVSNACNAYASIGCSYGPSILVLSAIYLFVVVVAADAVVVVVVAVVAVVGGPRHDGLSSIPQS